MKISVCMITYNHENYIREAIEGVLMQNIDCDMELIISNDCSTDTTDAVIKEIIQSHPKGSLIKYFFHEQNLGMMPNFIFALKQCSGEYVALCEGDDYWTDENKLQKQIAFLDNNKKYAGCFHNVLVINEMVSDFKPKPWREYDKHDFTQPDTFSRLALFHTCSFVFRQRFLEFPTWFEKVKSGDMALFSIISAKGKLRLIDGIMAVYRKNERGVTSGQKIIDYHKNRIRLMRFFKAHFGVYQTHLNEIIAHHRKEIIKTYKKKVLSIFKIK
ncbi:MAG: glycosyl transferase [Flavobacteriaceae bacterium]|nr:hypothetical protein ASG38_05785 [Flavobacterium sp. Leaf359]PZO33493.1 MAG: glycosyl transferase [Flavobacteriaceae bacterium]